MIAVYQWVLFLLLTVYYFYRTVNYTFTSTWRFLSALILVNTGTLISIISYGYHILGEAFVIIAEAMLLVAFIFIYDYHDKYHLTEARGILKFIMLFLVGYLMGRLMFPLILRGEIILLEQNQNVLFLTNILASIAFMRSIFYLNFENITVQKYYDGAAIRNLRTFSGLFFVLVITSSVYFYVNYEFLEQNPLLGFMSTMLTLGLLTLAYTRRPFRDLAFPINIVWIGITNDRGRIIYSYQFERSQIHNFRYEDLIAKFEQSYTSINSLLSEALSVDLQIESFNGRQFSFIQHKIDGGAILGIIDETNSSLVTYDYQSLFEKLQSNGSPLKSIRENSSDHVAMDQYLIKSLREGKI